MKVGDTVKVLVYPEGVGTIVATNNNGWRNGQLYQVQYSTGTHSDLCMYFEASELKVIDKLAKAEGELAELKEKYDKAVEKAERAQEEYLTKQEEVAGLMTPKTVEIELVEEAQHLLIGEKIKVNGVGEKITYKHRNHDTLVVNLTLENGTKFNLDFTATVVMLTEVTPK